MISSKGDFHYGSNSGYVVDRNTTVVVMMVKTTIPSNITVFYIDSISVILIASKQIFY